MLDWFVSVREDSADLHHYRAGQSPDQIAAIERVIAAGQLLARTKNGSIVGIFGKAVIDGTSVDSIPFGLGIDENQLRRLITTQFDRVRKHTGQN